MCETTCEMYSPHFYVRVKELGRLIERWCLQILLNDDYELDFLQIFGKPSSLRDRNRCPIINFQRTYYSTLTRIFFRTRNVAENSHARGQPARYRNDLKSQSYRQIRNSDKFTACTQQPRFCASENKHRWPSSVHHRRSNTKRNGFQCVKTKTAHGRCGEIAEPFKVQILSRRWLKSHSVFLEKKWVRNRHAD